MKPVALLSDVHANLSALNAVLADICQRDVSDMLFLGDAVGYGPRPSECTELLAADCSILVAGNHDHAVMGLTDISGFNDIAADAAFWTMSRMKEKAQKIITDMPMSAHYKPLDLMVVHATPFEPENWHYAITAEGMALCFDSCSERICSIGHSHVPIVTELNEEGIMQFHPVGPEASIKLNETSRYLINPGSVGQPRDRDPRASYMLLWPDKVELVRVTYDIRHTIEDMSEAGLHIALQERLKVGR